MNLKNQITEMLIEFLDKLASEFEDQDDIRVRSLKRCAITMSDAVQGHARYEAVRILNPREYAELWSRALLGERFDDMVDELVKAENEPK